MFDIFAESREQARSEAIPWGELEGKCVLITGATGLIGFACARLLLERNRLGLGPQIRVLCLVRNEERAREIFSAYGEDDGLEMVVGSVEGLPSARGLHRLHRSHCLPHGIEVFRGASRRDGGRPGARHEARAGAGPGEGRALAWCTLPAWKPTAMAMPSRDFITC